MWIKMYLEVEQMALVDGFDVQDEGEEGIKGDCFWLDQIDIQLFQWCGKYEEKEGAWNQKDDI